MNQFNPISFQFVAAGIARRARIALMRFQPSQKNDQSPRWDGREGDITTADVGVPITDINDWNGRYILTELTIRKSDGEKLVINDAIVTINSTKNIVKTSLVGLEGTIKEYINTGDYDITISVGVVAVKDGVIVDEYPTEGMQVVKEFISENEALEVQSVFLDLFSISRMVVAGFSAKQETYSNRQTIEIKALSDVDYEIKNTEY